VANDDLDLDFDGDDSGDSGNGMKALRQQNKKLAADLKKATDQIDEFAKERRTGDLSRFLEDHGADKRLAKHASRELEGDVTSESVLKWLEAEGDLFGWEAPQDDDPAVEQTKTNARRISAATTSAPDAPSGALTADMIRGMDIQTLIERGIIAPK
jgi:hypothetical protein